MSTDEKLYRIKTPVLRGGKKHTEGKIALTDEEAAELKAFGAIEDDDSQPNSTPTAPTDPAERLTLIKAAITYMDENKVEENWTLNSGPKLKPLADAVGWEVTVEERNQAFAELHPAPQE